MTSMRFAMVPILGLFFLAAGCGDALIEYRDEPGKFRIRLPGTPSEDKQSGLPASVKAVRFTERGGTFTIAWQDLDLGKDNRPDEQRLEDACNAIAKLKGKELSRKGITVGGHPGRDLVLQTTSGKTVLHDRMVLAGPRLYSVIAQGERWWVEREATKKVIGSFRLIEE